MNLTTANFPSLLAWFTSSDASKFNLTTSGSYKYVDKWTSKNDANVYITFPWTGSSNINKPLYIEAGTTPNSISYTKPFNEKNIVFLDDLSKKHETHPPYTILYQDTIKELDRLNTLLQI